jgi:hypothetical protein
MKLKFSGYKSASLSSINSVLGIIFSRLFLKKSEKFEKLKSEVMRIKIQISLLLFLVVTLANAAPRGASSSSESLEYADEYDEEYDEEYSEYYEEE